MNLDSLIYVAGHRGLVGSSLVRALQDRGYTRCLTISRNDLDLRNQSDVNNFFRVNRPEYVFLAAAKVGGILANHTYPADFLYDNLMIQANVINAALAYEVRKLLFLGSSCIYPRRTHQPIKEEYLLTGSLEPTNQWYAISKICGIKMCQSFRRQHGLNSICLMPTNLYGIYDNFDLATSHVLPALIRKFHEAKINRLDFVEVWGSGLPRREFLHVDDLANACLFLMDAYESDDIINVGTGMDISISELAELIKSILEYEGEIRYDSSKPDGTPQKLLDISKIRSLGWSHQIPLAEGILLTYKWFLDHVASCLSQD